jgi:hypothetical protein
MIGAFCKCVNFVKSKQIKILSSQQTFTISGAKFHANRLIIKWYYSKKYQIPFSSQIKIPHLENPILVYWSNFNCLFTLIIINKKTILDSWKAVHYALE